MAGSLSDKIVRVSDSDTGRPVISTLASSKALGATSITLSDTTNWTTTTKIHFKIYATTIVSGVTVEDTSTQTDWVGTLSGTTISNVTLTGGTDRTYNAGATVELTNTAKWAKDLFDGLAVLHNPDGTLRDNAVSASSKLADGIITGSKLSAATITGDKLDPSAITLGYVEITSNFISTATAATQVTGLTLTVTIPAGGRRVRLTAYTPNVVHNSIGDDYLSIWDGTVGSGTQLQEAHITIPANGYGDFMTASRVISPAAGTKTYNVGFRVNANQGTLGASVNAPAYLLVELI